MNDGDPHRRVRRRGEAAHHARAPTRCRRATTTPTTARPSKVRTLMIEAFARAYEQVDLLLGADRAHGGLRLRRQDDGPDGDVPDRTSSRSRPTSPATRPISVPFGTGEAGLPVGVQLLGPARGEAALFAAARVLEVADGPPVTLRAGWEMVVGLEVHTELRTATKMFCGCAQRLRRRAQHQRLPGVPRAARLAAGAQRARGRAGHGASARRCTARSRPRPSTARTTSIPTCPRTSRSASTTCRSTSGGWLDLPDGSRVGIERAHLEEDTGKSTHLGGSGRIHGADRSLVDYNRSGVPLVEIVSRARHPLRRPGARLRRGAAGDPRRHRRLGRADGGGVDAGRRQRLGAAGRATPLGTRCEIKNLNSLRCLSAGHRPRGRAPDRAARGRADGASKRRATGTRRAASTVDHAVQGGGLRLPLLPRARPRRPRPGRGLAGRGARGAARHAGRAARRRLARLGGAHRGPARRRGGRRRPRSSTRCVVAAVADAGGDAALALRARGQRAGRGDRRAWRRLDPERLRRLLATWRAAGS